MADPKLIIVFGRGHGGTRAMGFTLARSGVYMGQPESMNVSADLVPAEPLFDACRLAGAHVRAVASLHWDFDELIQGPIPDKARQLIHNYAREPLSHVNGPRGWKAPENLLILPWLVKMFPEAYFIHWTRDPRSNVLGGHTTDDLRRYDVPLLACDRPATPLDACITEEAELAMRLVSWTYQAALVDAMPRPAHFLQLRFEDFLARRDEMRRALERFLEMPIVLAPLDRERIAQRQLAPRPPLRILPETERLMRIYGY